MKHSLTYLLACLWCWATLIPLRGIPLHVFIGGTDASGDYTVNTAVFDGTNDYIRSSGVNGTGITDGTVVTMAYWVKISAINTAYHVISTATGGASTRLDSFISSSSSVIRFRAYDSGAAAVADLTSSVTLSASTWYHVYWCVDTASSANTKLYVNGTEDTSLTETTLSGTIDLLATGYLYTVGGNSSGSPAQKLNGSLAELWVNDSYLDAVGSFYSAGGPVDLGTNGATPTGGQPVFYFSGAGSGDAWLNQGTAGGSFSVTGTLGTDTSP